MRSVPTNEEDINTLYNGVEFEDGGTKAELSSQSFWRRVADESIAVFCSVDYISIVYLFYLLIVVLLGGVTSSGRYEIITFLTF